MRDLTYQGTRGKESLPIFFVTKLLKYALGPLADTTPDILSGMYMYTYVAHFEDGMRSDYANMVVRMVFLTGIYNATPCGKVVAPLFAYAIKGRKEGWGCCTLSLSIQPSTYVNYL